MRRNVAVQPSSVRSSSAAATASSATAAVEKNNNVGSSSAVSFSSIGGTCHSTMAMEQRRQWMDAQQADARIKSYLQYVADGTLPASVSSGSKQHIRLFRRMAADFRLVDSLLMRRRASRWQLVVPGAFKELVLKDIHASGHFGVARTAEKLRRDWWWENMDQDVHAWVTACVECQLRKTVHSNVYGLLHPIVTEAEPFATIGLDVVSGLPESQRCTKMVVIVDYFTKMVGAYPIVDEKAVTIADALLKWIWQYGAPRKIISDRGCTLLEQVNQALLHHLGIDSAASSAYHPQTDGLAERVIGIVSKRRQT